MQFQGIAFSFWTEIVDGYIFVQKGPLCKKEHILPFVFFRQEADTGQA
jgi:hypothetical protein